MTAKYLAENDFDKMSEDVPFHDPAEDRFAHYNWSDEPDWGERLQAWASVAGTRTLDELIIILGLAAVGFFYGKQNSSGQWVIDDIARGVIGWIVGGELSRIFIAYFSKLGMPGSGLTITAAVVLAILLSRKRGRSQRRVP